MFIHPENLKTMCTYEEIQGRWNGWSPYCTQGEGGGGRGRGAGATYIPPKIISRNFIIKMQENKKLVTPLPP
jgi:hypothetical protein